MITLDDLTEAERDKFISSLVRPTETRERREHVLARANVMRGDFKALLRSWVKEIYEDPEIIGTVMKHAFALYNPMKRAANRLAVAYSRRPRRTIAKRKTATKQLNVFLKQLRYDRRARYANRNGVALNTVVALPLIRTDSDGEPTIEITYAHGGNSEVLRHPNSAKHSAPEILGYVHNTQRRYYDEDNLNEPVVTIVDARGWSQWTSRGTQVGEVVEHGLGVFPGVQLHMADDEEDCDWYDAFVNAEILEATKRVALTATSMDWTRKTQCRNLLTVIEGAESSTGEDGEAQIIGDPENAWRLKGEAVSAQVQSFDQSVEPFLRHIRALTDEGLEIMTGTISTLADPDPAHPLEGTANARQHSALMHHQEEQLSEIEPFDKRLIYLCTKLAAMIGMDAPDAEMVKERLETEYSQVPYIEDQRARLEFHVLATKFGVSNQVEWIREQTGRTADEAIDYLEQLAEQRNQIRLPLEDHQTPNDPTQEGDSAMPGESLPARQGRAGGRASMPSEGEAAR